MQQKQIKEYEIDFEKYDIIKEIDKGAFSIIYVVKNRETKIKYASKLIYVKNKKAKRMINHEIQVMSTLMNPTIIKFHGFSYQNQRVTILMDLMTEGSLEKVLNQTAESLFERGFDNTSRQIILVGISYGMMILHQNNIVHCDLKPGNVLIDENFHPHISDFGSSQFIRNQGEKIQSKVDVTSIYTAPEVFEGEDFDKKADVFSFAIIMYQILTGKRPYPRFDKKLIKEFNLLQQISEENYRPEIPKEMPNSFSKLLKRCWNRNPKKRPNFEEIFNRLAFNKNCFVFDIFDEENEEEEDDENDENEQSYYLDKVDERELFQYIDLITEKSNKSIEKVDSHQKEINLMKKKIKKNEEYISEQNDIIDKLKEQINNQQKTINSMKKEIMENKEAISEQNNKIKKQKLRFDESEKQIKELIDNKSSKSQNVVIQPISSLPSLKTQRGPMTPPAKRKIKPPTISPIFSSSSNKIRSNKKRQEVKKSDEEHKENQDEDELKEEKVSRGELALELLSKEYSSYKEEDEELSEKSKEEYNEEESYLENALLLPSIKDDQKKEEYYGLLEKEYKEEALSEKSEEECDEDENYLENGLLLPSIKYDQKKEEYYGLLEKEYKEEALSEKSKEEYDEEESYLENALLFPSIKDDQKKEEYYGLLEKEYKEEALSEKSKEEYDEEENYLENVLLFPSI